MKKPQNSGVSYRITLVPSWKRRGTAIVSGRIAGFTGNRRHQRAMPTGEPNELPAVAKYQARFDPMEAAVNVQVTILSTAAPAACAKAAVMLGRSFAAA